MSPRKAIISTVSATVAAVAVMAPSALAQCGKTIFTQDFDQHSGAFKGYTHELASEDWPGLGFTRGFERAAVGEGTLRLQHPKGGIGTHESGMLMVVNLQEEVEEATLSYKVKFAQGYDWTAGGKLPGLCDEDCPQGCENTNTMDSGWSARVMWREDGEMESYMYYPFHDSPACGAQWPYELNGQPINIDDNKWVDVSMYVKLNTLGKANGIQRVWVDGQSQPVLDRTDVTYTMESGHGIKKFIFQNFHGGKTAVFAPDNTQYQWFDDFELKEGLCVPGGTDDGIEVASAKSTEAAPEDITEDTTEDTTDDATKDITEDTTEDTKDDTTEESTEDTTAAITIGVLDAPAPPPAPTPVPVPAPARTPAPTPASKDEESSATFVEEEDEDEVNVAGMSSEQANAGLQGDEDTAAEDSEEADESDDIEVGEAGNTGSDESNLPDIGEEEIEGNDSAPGMYGMYGDVDDDINDVNDSRRLLRGY